MALWIRVPEMELKRVPLGLPRDASYSFRFREEDLALRVVLGKSSFAQGLRWSPQNDPAASCVARKEVVLTGIHLFLDSFFFYLAMIVPGCGEGGLKQIFCCCSLADEEYWRPSTEPQIIARAHTATGPH